MLATMGDVSTRHRRLEGRRSQRDSRFGYVVVCVSHRLKARFGCVAVVFKLGRHVDPHRKQKASVT
jgi:predicted nuclease with RNAse H fold